MRGATSAERQDAFLRQIKEPHEVIIRERVVAHDGHVVNGTGDGFLLAFGDAERAVLCAVEIQQRIAAAAIITPDGPLRIRIGLHSGQAKPKNGDYTASATDKASRVESKAETGTVYLSTETHALVSDKLRGVLIRSTGEHEMKGVGKQALFCASLAATSAWTAATTSSETTVPPYTTIPHNLPHLPHFFGREKELKTIADALSPKTRTWGVLIDGPGGMGKTSLAIKAAESVPLGTFQRTLFLSSKERKLTADGERKLSQFVVPGYLDMLNEMARQLGRSELAKLPETDRARAIVAALEPAHALLVLDNLESLPKEQQNQVFEFLSQLPPGCKAIVTSRRRTDVDARIIRLGKLEQEAALALFAELEADRPLLKKARETERIHLYEETGGNPLLLRWIVGQLGRGSCRTLADALALCRRAENENDPLEFIFGDLLETFTDAETKCLAALTYFTQMLEVKHVAELAELSKNAAQTSLSDLANRALVLPDEEERCFALVPMVADFLRHKRPEVINETGDRLEKRALALAVENGYQKHDRFPVLEAAWPTVAAALPRFLAGEDDRLQTVCRTLADFLDFTGRWDEWLALSRDAENRAVAAGNLVQAGDRAYDAGWVHHLRQQSAEVLACAKRAEAHWSEAKPSTPARSAVMQLRGHGHRSAGDYPAAIAAYRKSLEFDRQHWGLESENVAVGLNALANAEALDNQFDAAERDYREALRIAHAIKDREGVATYTGNLAGLALDRKDWPGAEALARTALPLSEKVGRVELIAEDCRRLAKALVQQGKKEEALPHARRAVAICEKVGSPDLASAQQTLAECEA